VLNLQIREVFLMKDIKEHGQVDDVSHRKAAVTSLADSLQITILKGRFQGREGFFVPYLQLNSALEVPEGFLMIDLIDFGDEVEVIL